MTDFRNGDVILTGGALMVREDGGGTWPTDPVYRWSLLGPDWSYRLISDPEDALLVARIVPGTLRLQQVVDLELGQFAVEPRQA